MKTASSINGNEIDLQTYTMFAMKCIVLTFLCIVERLTIQTFTHLIFILFLLYFIL